MVSVNGIHSNVHMLECPSDHPIIDVIPSKPTPKWPDAFPKFTHNVAWVDSDGITHSMTLRSDSLQSLMADLRMVKSMIRAAKQKHSTVHPESDGAQSQDTDTQHCALHGVDMPRRWSKRTNGHYFGHKAPDGSFCYGKAKA